MSTASRSGVVFVETALVSFLYLVSLVQFVRLMLLKASQLNGFVARLQTSEVQAKR